MRYRWYLVLTFSWLLVAFLAPVSLGCLTACGWKQHSEITGVGEIQNVGGSGYIPSDHKNVHYAGTGTPEYARFQLGQDPYITDEDDQALWEHEYDQDPEDGTFVRWITRGIAPLRDWECSHGGSMTDGGLISVFTPSSQIHADITITCTLSERADYGWIGDEDVVRTWQYTLDTFMVGVSMEGTHSIDTFYENDEATEKIITEYDDIDELESEVETGTLEQPGIVQDDEKYWSKDLSWTAVAHTYGLVDVEGTIVMQVRFRQKILVDGTLEL